MKTSINLIILISLVILSIGFISAGNIVVLYPNNNITFNTTTININYSLSNANYVLYNYSCKLGTLDIGCNGTNYPITGSEGNNILFFYVNESNSSISNLNITNFNYSSDSSLPIITITYQGNIKSDIGYYNRTNIDINYTITDTSPRSSWYTIDGLLITNNTYTSNTKLTVGEGQHNFTLYANDSVGHIQSKNVTFIVDLKEPKLNQTNITDVTYKTAIVYFYSNEWVNTIIRYGSNISDLDEDNDGEGFFDHITLSGLGSNTTYYFNITICDVAGNCLTNGTYNFTTSIKDYNNTVVAITISGCTAIYNYSDWNECKSDGTQIRTYINLNSSCIDPPPIIRQSCVYQNRDIILYGTANNDTKNVTTSNLLSSYSWSGLSILWKTVIIIVGILVICVVLYLLYTLYITLSVNEETTEYDPMGGYGINDYYQDE